MLYPKFIKKNETIGICAPSAGVGRKLESFDLSLSQLHTAGFQTYETKGVRLDNLRGGSAKERVKELTELLQNPEIAMILCASGGDFLIEMLPYFDFDEICKHPKWIMGASDPTSLLFPITTKYDVATMYGLNAGAFDQSELHPSLCNAIDMMQGKNIVQTSFDFYEPTSVKNWLGDYQLCEPVHWLNPYHCHKIQGRLIGGCLDALKDLLGTPYDGTQAFIQRYQKDGIVWYFDIYSMSAENVYRTLLQMKSMGYFETTCGILVGRVLFESSETGMNYEEAFMNVFENTPLILNADIGHTAPKITLINGAIIDVTMDQEDQAKITFKLK